MAKLKLEEMKGTHLRSVKQLDVDYSSPPWNNDTWQDKWTDNREAFGVVIKQLYPSDKMWHIVGFALAVQTPDGYKITKLCIKNDDEKTYESIASKLLHSFVGKVTIWVRGRNVVLCKLLVKCGFSCIRTKTDAFTNPVDDGYKFEKLIEHLSISLPKQIEENSVEGMVSEFDDIK